MEVFYLFGAFLGVVSFCASFYVLVELKAMQKSTHQIQYVPVEDKAEGQTLTAKQKVDPYADDFDNII